MRPFIDAVEKKGLARFKWINGGHAATPPPGFDEYFGPGPLYRFIDFDGVSELDDMLSRLRDIPQGMTAEDAMRRLVGDKPSFQATAIQNTLDRLMMILDEDPEITVRLASSLQLNLIHDSYKHLKGILGYSEGATVAASLILEEQRRYMEEGRARRIKVISQFQDVYLEQIYNPRLPAECRILCRLATGTTCR